MKNLFSLRRTTIGMLAAVLFCLVLSGISVTAAEEETAGTQYDEYNGYNEYGEYIETNETNEEEYNAEETTETAEPQLESEPDDSGQLPQTGIDNIVPVLAISGIAFGFLVITAKEVYSIKKKRNA
ncbi:MAG: hypothetical protein FWH24_03025 [Oscillospiraceae bacterium]|nr:hypothetical protein [Oscillospiraceae bacterium]